MSNVESILGWFGLDFIRARLLVMVYYSEKKNDASPSKYGLMATIKQSNIFFSIQFITYFCGFFYNFQSLSWSKIKLANIK